MISFSLTFSVFLSVLCDNLLLTVVVPILPEFLREKASLDISISQEKKFPSMSAQKFSTIENNGPQTNPMQNLVIKQLENSINNNDKKILEDNIGYIDQLKSISQSCIKQLFHLQMLDEDSKLGLLFSTKAFVQLICNPLVGKLTHKIGYKLPLCIGNFILLLCSLSFGFANSYTLLFIGRSCHGLASSLIVISGMALVAELYPIDIERTKVMGRVMGAAALGVLIGYPFGGLFYAFIGKLFPFIIIAGIALFNSAIYGSQLQTNTSGECTELTVCIKKRNENPFEDDKNNTNLPVLEISNCWTLLKDKSILIICTAIWFSTMAMAVLEPTLPVWLIESIDPPKWQLGLVFVPDSIGYFIGTNFFGELALRMGRWKTSMISMGAIGVACLVLPLCNAIWQLMFPHFTLGLGLGVVDASLMPLLACFADDKHRASYGSVYALAQTSVALAYALGPLLGGQLVRLMGFTDLIRSVGFLNLIFCPFILLLAEHENQSSKNKEHVKFKLGTEEDYSGLSTSCSTLSSFEEIPKISNNKTKNSKQKHVRFHFHIDEKSYPLKSLLKFKAHCQPNSYERFDNNGDVEDTLSD